MTVPALLEIKGIGKTFGGHRVLQNVSLSVKRGEFMTFLGPSGCGKTTTLRIIAGLDDPDQGSVHLSGKDVTSLPAYKRDVHTVFQHYALFPHLNVYENIAFGLRLKKAGDAEISRKVAEALALVKLSGFEGRGIQTLSGGQQQRVALARAIVGRPSLLLLDEPLGALDLKLRLQMQLELKNIQKETGITFIYVTHDQQEALTLSDRIAVFNHGKIVQLGTPKDIYESPVSGFVADFIGNANVLEGKAAEGKEGGIELRFEEGFAISWPRGSDSPVDAGQRCSVAIRPERLSVSFSKPPNDEPDAVTFLVFLKEEIYLGSATQYILAPTIDSTSRIAAISQASYTPGEMSHNRKVWLRANVNDVIFLKDINGTGPSEAN